MLTCFEHVFYALSQLIEIQRDIIIFCNEPISLEIFIMMAIKGVQNLIFFITKCGLVCWWWLDWVDFGQVSEQTYIFNK